MIINKITSNTILLICFPLFVFGQGIKCNNDTNDSTKCYLEKKYIKPKIVLEKKWEVKELTELSQVSLVADMDGDCIPEFLSRGFNQMDGSKPDTPRVHFYDGRDGSLKWKFDSHVFDPFLTPVIADVDNDGSKEIILSSRGGPGSWAGFISCYEFSGKLKWKSDEYFYNRDYDPGHAIFGVADFNQDGMTEVYSTNRIFNGQTGKLLAEGGTNGIGATHVNDGSGKIAFSLSVAAQLDDELNDLELAAGHTVYKVKITNLNGRAGNQLIPLSINIDNQFRDGNTSIADINGDGKLDVIVSYSAKDMNSRLYAYSLKNGIPNLIAKNYIPGKDERNGCPTIADIDGNGIPNILVSKHNLIHNFEYDGSNILKLKWSLVVRDTYAVTGITTFDLDGDGIQEIIYRDHINLLLIDGSVNPPQIIDSIRCLAGTFFEYPTIADIDHSGEAKICVVCRGTPPHPFVGHLTAFGSPDSLPGWAPARGIWNQYAYNPLFINDDLTVPAKPKNHATYENGRYNNFMQQASLLDSNGMYKVAAASLWGEIACINYDQMADEYTVSFNVFNHNNASARADVGLPISFYNGDPTTGGNLLGIFYTTSQLNPGDRLLQQEFKFKVSQIQDLYMVVNTKRDTSGAFDPKDFSSLECDYADNVFHTTDIPKTEKISASICKGSEYQFFDSTLNVQGRYVHTSSNVKGCDSLITILELTVVDTVHTSQSLTACDSVDWNGTIYRENGTFINHFKTIMGCDSVVSLNLIIRHSSDTLVQAVACRKFDFNDKVYTEGGKFLINLRNKQGCDSTIELHLSIIALDTNITKLGNTLIALDSMATYQWIDCNDQFASIPGATQKTYKPDKDGSYAVIISNPPCIDTTMCLPIIISNTIEQNGQTVYIYPNPVSHTLFIRIPELLPTELILSVRDIHGSTVIKKIFTKENRDVLELDVSNLSAGIYSMDIRSTIIPFQLIFLKM